MSVGHMPHSEESSAGRCLRDW